MGTAIAGLDIGANSVKAVLLSRDGGNGSTLLAAEFVNIIDEQEGLESALKKLAETNIFRSVPSCICLSLEQVMFRQVSLPFHDDKKIRKTLPFELETQIPLPKEEIVSDYLKNEEKRLLVAVADKKKFLDLVEGIESILTAHVIIVDVSLATLAYQIMEKSSPDECGILLNIGARNTEACFYENGNIAEMRLYAFGCESLTGSLAKEKTIQEVDILSFLLRASQEEAGGNVCQACTDFCREIRNTFEIMRINGTLEKEVSRIILSGGGAVFPVLGREVEKFFSVPVEILDVAALDKIEIGQNIKEKYHPQIMNGALAAATRLSLQRRGFNFRKGEFAHHDKRFNVGSGVRRAAIVVLVIIFMGVANLIGGWALQAYRASTIKKQIALIFKKNYPEAQVMIDPLQQLKTKLAADKKTFGFYGTGEGATVVDILKEISVLIPAATEVVLMNLSYENGIVVMGGKAQNMDAVSEAKNELIKSRYFQNVDIASSNLEKESGKVQFSMRIELK